MLSISTVLPILGKWRRRAAEVRKPPPKLKVIFFVAIAVRKFQKFATDKFKKSLTYYFDKHAALDELKALFHADKAFFTREFVKVAYFLRKFDLTFNDLSQLDIVANIYRHLEKGLTTAVEATAEDRKMLHFLCLSLKYLTRNSSGEEKNPLKVSLVVDLIRTAKNRNRAINDTLVTLLAHLLEKSRMEMSDSQISGLETLILNLPGELGEEARAFFLSKLESNKATTKEHTQKENPRTTSMSVRKVKKNQQVVSKTIQTVRSKQETKKSEETDLKLIDLSDCMMNRNRQRSRNAMLEKTVETTEDKSGSDQSMFRTTWAEMIVLFELVSQGQVLKKEDKDTYLPEKFLGYHYFTGTFWNGKLGDGNASKLYSFFINRMCASIFEKISRKQQLNNQAGDKLMKCITDFKGLKSELDLGDDLVKLFVDSIFDRYWQLKELTSPNIVVDFVKVIMSKTTEEYVDRGWIYNSTKVRQKSYDRADIEKIISLEVNLLRLDAVKALYNCAVRDKKTVLSKDRVQIITSAHLSKEVSHPDAMYEDFIFKLIEVAETLDDFNYADIFKNYLSRLQDDECGGETLKRILTFLKNQARDLKRSRELFSDVVMETLIDLLSWESKLSKEQQLELVDIINTCLQHEHNKGLSEKNLEKLLETSFGSDDAYLINPALTSLLLSTDKTGTISPSVFNRLFANIDLLSHNEQWTSYVVFILSRMYCSAEATTTTTATTGITTATTATTGASDFIDDPSVIEWISNKILCDHLAELNDEDGHPPVSFNVPQSQTPENTTYSSNQISMLAAKIILRSIDNDVAVTAVTIDNLLLVFDKPNKQTKIVASKCLYSLAKYVEFETGLLNQLLDLIDSPIYDVGVYLQAAYLRACAEVAIATSNNNSKNNNNSNNNNSRLDPIHLENLSGLYSPESLILGSHDYEPEINENLFETLLHESGKRELTDKNAFLLFDNILNLDGKYAPQVLKILVAYTFKYALPECTVRTMENLLGVSSYFEEALLVLQNVILGGQSSVTSKTLSVFMDYLWLSSNRHLRVYSFKLLKQASQNQELADNIFSKLELVRAGYALECHPTDRQKIIEFVQSVTDKGMQLPIDTNLALETEICDVGVLKIFANVSRNKQIIGRDLLKALIKLFKPENRENKDINVILITIFENATKNNQTLPWDLLGKLEKALDKKDLERNALLVFNYLAQKGEKLSLLVNNKLLHRLLDERDPVLIQELLSSLGSLIDANRVEISLYLPKINQILVREIGSDNSNVQKLCINAVYKLVTVCKEIDTALLEQLMETCTDVSCSKTTRNGIQAIFDAIEDSHNPSIRQKHYREKIKLANLSNSLPKDLLDQLHCYANLGHDFLEQNYKQLKDIIDNESVELQEKALKMLLSYNYKSKLSNELLDSVAILHESTMSDMLKNLCLQLLNEAVKSGKALTGRARQILGAKLNRDENTRTFLQSQFCHKIKQEFELSDKLVSDLLELIQDSEEIPKVQELDDLLQLIIKQKPDYFLSESFVLLVEQCLLKKSCLQIALPCYCRIIKEKKSHEAEKCLQGLVEHFIENEQDLDESLKTWLFASMYHACKNTQLPDVCMAVATVSLDNDNEVIRGNAFGILKASKDERFKTILDKWCTLMQASLADTMNVKIEKSTGVLALDLLEIVVSLKFLDVNVFRNHKENLWKRELLASSIFEKFSVLKLDQIHFYTNWLRVEEKFKYHKSCKILLLIHNSKFDLFSQIVELILMIPDLSFEDVSEMLNNYGPAPYEAFKQDWCARKIQTCTKGGFSIKYSHQLAEKLCSNFNVSFIGKLFGCLKSINNLSAFENLIDFCAREKIDLNDLLLDHEECAELNDLVKLVEAKHLIACLKCQPKSQTEEKQFIQIYKTFCNSGWKFAQLRDLAAAFNPMGKFNRFRNLLHFLNTIQIYGLFSLSNLEKSKQILTDNTSFQTIMQKLNKLAIENHFQLEGKVKDLNELVAELKKENKHDRALVNFIDSDVLNIKKHIFETQSVKLEWNEKQIFLWARDVKSSRKEFSDYEGIAIILRANFLITGHTLTDTQILCSLIALRTGGSLKGKLLEVATGEGKSTIICILAIINALRCNRVDVITSSPVLAERDAKQKAKLYRMFGLTCSDNNDKTVYVRGKKSCYSADIVYGEMSQFQFDILRDSYSKLETLGGRQFAVAIVDEVDSMLIDDSSKIARLSSTISGMDHFQAIYVFIWQRLLSIKEKFIMFKNKLYFVDGKVGFKDGKITLEVVDENNDIWKIPDLEEYLVREGDDNQIAVYIGDDVDEYLRKSLEYYLDCQIKENKIYIPSNFADFLQKQKPKWITNAVEALNYQENVHYVVQGGEIKPVDYYSTGIVQSSTSWSDGLHQFLQLKHNLKMTSETITTNFLSNMGLMSKYKKVYGLTGTLGSETARAVLNEVYGVDLINIPQRRQKQYLELESIVAEGGETGWLKEIMTNIVNEIRKDRGILVICETIENTNRISKMLKEKLPPKSVKLYAMNDMDQEKNVEKILPGEVIIATNLAGRGTDIQTDEIEKTGGLHVILTFMPGNQRVEDQAFGRTARQGKRGTGLMILNGHQLFDYGTTTTTATTTTTITTTKRIKMARDAIESEQLRNFQDLELKPIQIKDKLFDKFCAFLNDKIRLTINQQEDSWKNRVKNVFTEALPTVYESSVLAAVEEQWAGFLSKLDEKVIKCEDAETECQKLIQQLWQDFQDNNIIKNPYHYISIANDILAHQSSKPKEALRYFEKTVELEQKSVSSEGDDQSLCCPGAAHVGIAWSRILLKEKAIKKRLYHHSNQL